MKFKTPINVCEEDAGSRTIAFHMLIILLGSSATIPVRINIEVPLPTPFIVIWSAIQIEIIEPAIIINVHVVISAHSCLNSPVLSIAPELMNAIDIATA